MKGVIIRKTKEKGRIGNKE